MFYLYLILSLIVDFTVGIIKKLIWWKTAVLYPLLFVGCIAIHLVVFCVASFFVKETKTENTNNFFRKFMIISLKLYLKLGLVKVETEGKEIIPDDGRFLFVSNHISVYDPIISIVELADKNVGFVSKKENLEIPIAGKYMIEAGCIGLDRDNNRSAVIAINQAAENIINGVCSMGIYPEGYVNENVGTLMEFRNGAFKIAKKAKSDIVVAVISNTREVNKKIFRHITHVKLKILEVIPYSEIEKLKTVEIGERVRSIMEESL